MNGVTRELTRAVDVARRASSIHDTQPWRLVVDGPVLEVRADSCRQLTELDPVVSNAGYLHLVVRLGVATADPVPDTPRLPVGETLEVHS